MTSQRQSVWDSNAAVRKKQRIIVHKIGDKHLFPVSRQPLCAHPVILRREKSVSDFLLLQSMYYFLCNIALIEVGIVNKAATQVLKNSHPFTFPDSIVLDMLSVITDEAYHAYVATDFVEQVEKLTGVKRVLKIQTTDLSYAIDKTKFELSERLHGVFELICVCISENTLTDELIGYIKEKNIHPLFKQVMSEHLSDEGRHAIIFREVLKTLWEQLTVNESQLLMQAALKFLKIYLNMPMKRHHEYEILIASGFSDADSKKIVSDMHVELTLPVLQKTNPVFTLVTNLFEKTSILYRDEVVSIFRENGLKLKKEEFKKHEII